MSNTPTTATLPPLVPLAAIGSRTVRTCATVDHASANFGDGVLNFGADQVEFVYDPEVG